MMRLSYQRGVGLVEVLIGALILAFAVTGTAVLLGDWLPAVNDSSLRTQALNRNHSVMEAARYKPDTTFISSKISSMQMSSGAGSFSITGINVTDGDSRETFGATVQWTDPYLTTDSKTKSFSLSSSVPDDTTYAPLGDFIASAPSLTISTSAGTGTTISPSSMQVLSGSTGSFTVGAQTGYINLVVTGCGGSLSGNTYTTGAVTADCTITSSATLDTTDSDSDGTYDWEDPCPNDATDSCGNPPVSYTVTPSAGAGTSISPASDQVSSGDPIVFTVSTNTGYQNLSVAGCNGTLSGNSYTTNTITADCTVTTTASQIPYTVSTNAGTGTSISPSSVVVGYGNTTQLTVTADSGYDSLAASGCSGSLSGDTFTTGAVTADCTVTSSASVASTTWAGTISFSASNGGGNGNYSYSVSYSDGSATCSGSASAGSASCPSITTSAGSVTATVTINASQVLCSSSPVTVILTEASPNGTVTVRTANRANRC